MSYSIVFSGHIRSGVSTEEARRNVGRLFRLDEGPQLAKLFSGQPVVIKKGLNEDEARRYADTLLKAGVHCEVKAATSAAPSASADNASIKAPPLQPQSPDQTPASTITAATSPAKSADPFAGLSLVPVEPRPEPEPEPAPFFNQTQASPHQRTAAVTGSASSSPYAVGRATRQINNNQDFNNSGGGAGTQIPEDARGLAWGAFFFNWIWGLFNRTYIALLCLVPYVGILFCFYLLFKGRELAWQNKRWESVEHFNKVQRRWAIAFLIFPLLGILAAITIPMYASYQKKHSGQLSGQLNAPTAKNGEAEAQMLQQRQQVLEKIEDPAVRAQMEEFYKTLDKARQEQAR